MAEKHLIFEFFSDDNASGVAYKNKVIKRLIINYLDINGNVTIAELTKELNISVPKITNLINLFCSFFHLLSFFHFLYHYLSLIYLACESEFKQNMQSHSFQQFLFYQKLFFLSYLSSPFLLDDHYFKQHYDFLFIF